MVPLIKPYTLNENILLRHPEVSKEAESLSRTARGGLHEGPFRNAKNQNSKSPEHSLQAYTLQPYNPKP